MEKTFAKVEELADHVKEYVNNRMDSVKLSVAERSSAVLSAIIAMIVVMVVFVIFIVFTGIALAFVFARLTGEYYWGFLIVAGIYLLIGILVWTLRAKLLQLPIMNAILHQLFKDEEATDEED